MKSSIRSTFLAGMLGLMFMQTPGYAQVAAPGVMPFGMPDNPAALQWARTSSIGAENYTSKSTSGPVGGAKSDYESTGTTIGGQMVEDKISLGFSRSDTNRIEKDPSNEFEYEGEGSDLTIGGAVLLNEVLTIGASQETSEITGKGKFFDLVFGWINFDGTQKDEFFRYGGTFRLGENLYLGAALGEDKYSVKYNFYDSGGYLGTGIGSGSRDVSMVGIAFSSVRGKDSGVHLEISLKSGDPFQNPDGSTSDDYEDKEITAEILRMNYFASIYVLSGFSKSYDPNPPETSSIAEYSGHLIAVGYAPLDGIGAAVGYMSLTHEIKENEVLVAEGSGTYSFGRVYFNF